ERLNGYTLIEAKLKTGRTHQIRVHMQSIGHPLAGDPVYGPKNIIKELEGQALHAGVIGFIHPVSGEYLEFSAPWCEQFTKFYNKARFK
ncbi:MAG: RNA pseudouridine synthase, partial [Oscillospiraceae bacterium]|nr:RNA pseudouridine synthase [Oscillospiraceae bacterium]